jgi:hypothetical protein
VCRYARLHCFPNTMVVNVISDNPAAGQVAGIGVVKGIHKMVTGPTCNYSLSS